jgi:hypothetical protein
MPTETETSAGVEAPTEDETVAGTSTVTAEGIPVKDGTPTGIETPGGPL